MAFFDLHQGFWFGLGFAPIVGVLVLLLKFLESRWDSEAEIDDRRKREDESYVRGYNDCLRTIRLQEMHDRLDQSISEKVADISATGERLREKSETRSGPGPHA